MLASRTSYGRPAAYGQAPSLQGGFTSESSARSTSAFREPASRLVSWQWHVKTL